MKRYIYMAVAIACVPLLALQAQAQQQPGTPQAGRTPAGTPQATDRQIAEWLAADNFVTVQLADLAKDQSESDDVKKFAEKLREEHKKSCDRLREAVPGVSLDPSKADDQQAAPAARPQTGQLADRPAFNISHVKQKIAQKRLSSLKDELKNLDGDAFDAAFLGSQVMQHQNLIATLAVLEGEASGSLKDVIQKDREQAKDHLDHAKKLMKDLKSDVKEDREG